jgi:hypothetical protein
MDLAGSASLLLGRPRGSLSKRPLSRTSSRAQHDDPRVAINRDDELTGALRLS